MKNNYDKILKAATRLINKRGYHGTSIQMIAEKAGVSKAGVLYHFKSKEMLLLSVVKEHVQSGAYELMLIVKEEKFSGMEKLKVFIRHQLKQIAEKGDTFNIYMSESSHFGKQNRKLYRDSKRMYLTLVKEIIEQAQKENGTPFDKLDSELAAFAILGMCGWAMMWYKNKGRFSIDEISDQFYQLVKEKIF